MYSLFYRYPRKQITNLIALIFFDFIMKSILKNIIYLNSIPFFTISHIAHLLESFHNLLMFLCTKLRMRQQNLTKL